MRFKLDENLPAEVVDVLRAAGHEAETVSEEGLAGAKDPQVLAACQAESRVLVTLDLDFADVRKYSPEEHKGIIVLRLHSQSRRSVLEAIRRILPLMNAEPLSGYLWIVDETQVRLRGEDAQ